MTNDINNINESLRKILIVEGIFAENDFDENDTDCVDLVRTRESLQNFIDNCESFKGLETFEDGNQKLTILRNFQGKKGMTRTSLFYLNFNNDFQNLVIL